MDYRSVKCLLTVGSLLLRTNYSFINNFYQTAKARSRNIFMKEKILIISRSEKSRKKLKIGELTL